MKKGERTRNLLTEHYRQYPMLQLRDMFKYLYQSSFGCEHMVSSLEAATDYIRSEAQTDLKSTDTLLDRLDGEYSRVHLAYLKNGLSAETLGKLFFASAKKEINGMAELKNKLDTAKELVHEKVLPFSQDEFEKATEEWRDEGYPSVHHSDVFRSTYKPSYRVIANKYVPFLPLLARLDEMLEKDSVVLAVEGGSASGKSTLSEILKELYDCTVFHMDDFFLRPEQRTPERYAEVGGNIDRERFLQEILVPLKNNEPIDYRRFDCSTFEILPPVEVHPKRLTVIEGVYSMHPFFGEYYDLSVFLDISPELQRERILKRNTPEFAERFFNEWIPLERKYFSKMNVIGHCHMTVNIE